MNTGLQKGFWYLCTDHGLLLKHSKRTLGYVTLANYKKMRKARMALLWNSYTDAERQRWEDQDVPDSIPEKKVDPTGFSIGESLGTDDPLLKMFQLQGDEGDTDPSTWVMGGWDEPDIIPLSEDEGEEQTWGDRNAAYWARVRAKNEKVWIQETGDSKTKLNRRKAVAERLDIAKMHKDDRQAELAARVRAKAEKMWLQEGREWDAAAGDSKWKLKERIRAAMEEDSRFTVIPPTPVRRRLVGDDLIYNHFTSIEPRIIDYARLGKWYKVLMNYFVNSPYHEELAQEDDETGIKLFDKMYQDIPIGRSDMPWDNGFESSRAGGILAGGRPATRNRLASSISSCKWGYRQTC